MFFILFGVLLSVAAQVSCWDETYRAAVVEYNPILGTNDKDTMNKNAKKYVEFITEAKRRGADIIVFPEHGLFSNIRSAIPDPVDRIDPSLGFFVTTEAVRDISAASKKNKIYSVVNLIEERKCEADDESCPQRGYYIYNTNVVFDRNGVVIARYAKYNLYEGDLGDQPKDPELVFFDTDFGVRFGTFICFDILFSTPAQRLVQQYQITDFVFSTYWFSELPFLTALQAQRGWAETNNVNLLASGVNFPKSGSFGSGIYNGKFGQLIEIMPETETSKLLIADVPKIQKRSFQNYCEKDSTILPGPIKTETDPKDEIVKLNPQNEVQLLKDNLDRFATEVITGGKTFEQTICSYKDFCCDFKVTMDELSSHSKNYTYRAVVYNGVRNFGRKFRGGVQTCGVVVCNGPHIANCTTRVKEIPGLFKFKEIQIKGNFNRRNSFQIPSTLTDGKELKPLSASKYEFVKSLDEKNLQVSLELLWPVIDLHTFAIWGRDFTRDNEPSVPESGASGMMSMPVLLTTFITFALFLR